MIRYNCYLGLMNFTFVSYRLNNIANLLAWAISFLVIDISALLGCLWFYRYNLFCISLKSCRRIKCGNGIDYLQR